MRLGGGRGSFLFNMQIYGKAVLFHAPEPERYMLKWRKLNLKISDEAKKPSKRKTDRREKCDD